MLSSIPQIRESVQAYCKNNPKTEEDDAIQSILLAILVEQVNSQKNGKDVNDDEFAQVVTSATEKTLNTFEESPDVEVVSIEEILGKVDDASIDEQIARKNRKQKIRDLLDKDSLITDFRKEVLWKRFGFEDGQPKSYEEIAEELNTTPDTIRFSARMGLLDVLISPTVIPVKLKELFPDKFQ